MKKGVKIIADDYIIKLIEEDSLKQAKNVASLPGLVGDVIVMPDVHTGYGFPIGGVAGIDASNGIVSPGGIGFDINCGVRLLITPLKKDDIVNKEKNIAETLFRNIPSGVGSESRLRLNQNELDNVLDNGVEWAIDNGYGNEHDKENCEEYGKMEQADHRAVSDKAKKRGKPQLGTLGAGNHFLEVQYVEKIYNKDIAKIFGINEEGQISVMIHCGSRGLGHQIATDYLREMERSFPNIVKGLVDKELIYAPVDSKVGQNYIKAMASAANYAWTNRHIIAHWVRESLIKEIGLSYDEIKLVYDVAHNIAKLETHTIGEEKKQLWVHRKGATRAFPARRKELPKHYYEVGQPVIIPGSMGTASYVLVGTEKAMQISFGSTAHGAGRVMSRHAANKRFRGEQVKQRLLNQGIYVRSASWKGLSEEAPEVYKQIDDVVRATEGAGIAKPIAKMRPLIVIKG